MICLNCGTEFNGRKRKYCNVICSRRYNNRKRCGYDISIFEETPPAGNYKPVILKCLLCRSSFKRKKNGGVKGNEYTKYCSRECSAKHRSVIAYEINSIRRIAARDKNIFKYKIAERTKRLIDIDHKDAKHNHCGKCGDGIEQKSSQCCKRYCESCRDKTAKLYAQLESTKNRAREKRREKRIRGVIPRGSDKSRAKHYGAEYEPISRSVVFDKAGWCCEQCGVRTPVEMKGKNKSNSPELDHIIPISKGGSHTYSNVQLLCRACNAIKSDKIPLWERI